MKLPGWCESCHRSRYVNTSQPPIKGLAIGICDECQDKEDEAARQRRGGIQGLGPRRFHPRSDPTMQFKPCDGVGAQPDPPSQSGRFGKCPNCDKIVRLRSDGTVQHHGGYEKSFQSSSQSLEYFKLGRKLGLA